MAKKNAREEPPKPQVTENEQMSDIVFILDKMELILEAVSHSYLYIFLSYLRYA